MQKPPLRYKISSWRQLPQCMSNNSRELHISVTDFIQCDILSGFRIQIKHDKLGILFACVLNSSGTLVSCPKCNATYEFTPSQILSELEKYGFLVEYNPEANLSGDQLQYLMTLNDLHYDKIRLLNVWEIDSITGEKIYNTQVVAFISSVNPYWLNNGYSCSKSEFNSALNSGSACNLTMISDTRKYNWSWLSGFVANIEDVIQDNAEVRLCQ